MNHILERLIFLFWHPKMITVQTEISFLETHNLIHCGQHQVLFASVHVDLGQLSFKNSLTIFQHHKNPVGS